jgi:hypothetical protein
LQERKTPANIFLVTRQHTFLTNGATQREAPSNPRVRAERWMNAMRIISKQQCVTWVSKRFVSLVSRRRLSALFFALLRSKSGRRRSRRVD